MQLNEETILPYFFYVVAIESITNSALLLHIERIGEVIYEAKY